MGLTFRVAFLALLLLFALSLPSTLAKSEQGSPNIPEETPGTQPEESPTTSPSIPTTFPPVPIPTPATEPPTPYPTIPAPGETPQTQPEANPTPAPSVPTSSPFIPIAPPAAVPPPYLTIPSSCLGRAPHAIFYCLKGVWTYPHSLVIGREGLHNITTLAITGPTFIGGWLNVRDSGFVQLSPPLETTDTVWLKKKLALLTVQKCISFAAPPWVYLNTPSKDALFAKVSPYTYAAIDTSCDTSAMSSAFNRYYNDFQPVSTYPKSPCQKIVAQYATFLSELNPSRYVTRMRLQFADCPRPARRSNTGAIVAGVVGGSFALIGIISITCAITGKCEGGGGGGGGGDSSSWNDYGSSNNNDWGGGGGSSDWGGGGGGGDSGFSASNAGSWD